MGNSSYFRFDDDNNARELHRWPAPGATNEITNTNTNYTSEQDDSWISTHEANGCLSYQDSRNLEAARLGLKCSQTLWILASISAAPLPIRMSNIFIQSHEVEVSRNRRCSSALWISSLGLYSLSTDASYLQTSWSIEFARLNVIVISLLWNLTGILPVTYQSD